MMKRFKQMVLGFIVTGLAIAGIATTNAAPASATVAGVSGGLWGYGTALNTWSNFYHPSALHRSSVKVCGIIYRSLDQPGNAWSTVSVAACLSGNEAFYNVY